MTSRFTADMAPFMGYDYWGVTGPILFAAIVAGQVAGEYQNGRAAKESEGVKLMKNQFKFVGDGKVFRDDKDMLLLTGN